MLLYVALTALALGQDAPPAEAQAVNPFEEPDESELFALDEQLVTVASKYAQTLRLSVQELIDSLAEA